MAIPAFGLGTFRLKDDVVISSVKTALELDYRAIDTAQIYDERSRSRSGDCRKWRATS